MPITPSGKNTAETTVMNVALLHLSKSPSAALALGLNYQVEINYSGSNLVTTVGGTLLWDPTTAMQVRDAQGVMGVQSPAMGLIHELAHALFGYNEPQATAFETKVALELGEPIRATYNDALEYVTVENPTQHTENGEWVIRDIFGNIIKGAKYDGSTTAPKMGWAGTAGSAGGSGGSGSSGGGGSAGPNPSTPKNPHVTPILLPE
ncbi:hypothetical protein ACQ4WP_28795 [Janthinobacterium sp. GB4P2]|uniref:hypothetical protein n=1 Tax=Janthinobacterium sp. GB4P2 TaxID=3424189 RepID=UPI003F2223D3